jgi:hypothetical protein
MDPRLEEYLKQHCGPHSYGEQDENGVDLSLIRENLKLSPLQRLRRMDRGARAMEELRKHVRRIGTKQT